MTEKSRGFGVAAGLDPEIATPLGSSLRGARLRLRLVERHADGRRPRDPRRLRRGHGPIDLGVAVIAIDRRTPEEIAAKIEELGLPRERLWLGVGAGFSKKPLTAMREHLPALRDALGDIRLVLAAMGPKMCAFAGAEFDGVFFNWMTPGFAADARKHVERGASDAGRETPPVMGYVRTAIGDDAKEAPRQGRGLLPRAPRRLPQPLRAPRRGAGTVGVAEPDSAAAQSKLDEFDALDVTVVRGLASANLEAMSALAEGAAP